jgi:hypothetical protein
VNKATFVMSLKGLGFKKLVAPPLDAFIGKKFNVLGSWWPTTTGRDKIKEFTLRVLDVNLKHITSTSAPGTKGTPHFKVQLVDIDDLHSTGVTELIEGTNFWWVTHQTFSDAYFDDKYKKEKANTDASLAAIASAAAASPATTATAEAKGVIVKPPFDFLWLKEPSQRDGKAGFNYRCFDSSCPKYVDPYFVGKGSIAS